MWTAFIDGGGLLKALAFEAVLNIWPVGVKNVT